jgi:hypothetical protein
MRAPDLHDDSPAKRRPARYSGPPATLGHIRSHGGRHLLTDCSEGLYCHLSVVINADRSVLLGLDRKAVCTECVMIGADVRPKWSEGAVRA